MDIDSEKTENHRVEDAIENILVAHGDNATYVIKNWLRYQYPNITTSQTRRRLERLAKDGVVERKRNPYSDVHLHWGLRT